MRPLIRSVVPVFSACCVIACTNSDVHFDSVNAAGGAAAGGAAGSLSSTAGSGGSDPGGSGAGGAGAAAGSGGASAGAGGVGAAAGSGVAGAAGASGSGPILIPTGRGADLPYTEYEAEDAYTNAATLVPSRKFGDVAAEAHGRKAVKLSTVGQYVRFTTTAPANGIVVRYSIPDGGADASAVKTLNLYVNDQLRTTLSLTSRWSWTYGDFGNPNPNDPAQGKPHHFFDEVHALVGDIPAGATVTLQKDAANTAAAYTIDLIDLEQVPAALPEPDGAMSIEDCGATKDDDTDDRLAIQTCLQAAHLQGKPLYIPQGTYRVLSAPLDIDGINLSGAGMWYSTLSGFNARLRCATGPCIYANFAVDGDIIARDMDATDAAFSGPTGSGSSLDQIWVEHSNAGCALGPGAMGPIIRRSRFRDSFAQGVLLSGGTSDAIVEQNQLRNTGDDALASLSTGGVNSNNVFRLNTVQLPWMADCIALYGGNKNRIEDNVCEDTLQYPGIQVAQQYNSHQLSGTTSVLRNNLIRAGGYAFNAEQGALKFYSADADMTGILIIDTFIAEPTYSGIQIQGPHRLGITLDGVTITNPGATGLRFNSDANGSLTATNVLVSGGTGLNDLSKGALVVTRQNGDTGW